MVKFPSIQITRRAVAPLFLTPWLLPGQPAATDAEWSHFLAWYKTTPPEVFRGSPDVVVGAYKAKLTADGMSAADAETLAKRLRLRSRTDPEYQRAAGNLNYAAGIDGKHGLRTTQANAFLAETISSIHPGKALDIGMGEGRNAVFLAQKGWDVTGVDLSDVGVAKANEQARLLGVRVNAQAQDINVFDLGTHQWDLVCLLYFPIDDSMPHLHERIGASLKPGGLVISKVSEAPEPWKRSSMPGASGSR